MQLSEFDVPFDPALIAAQPVLPRDQARLLRLTRATGAMTHHHVCDLPELLEPGDLLVVNDTKVLPARLVGHKQPTGTPVEVLFVKNLGGSMWEVLIKGRLRVGQLIAFGAQSRATIVRRDKTGTAVQVESPIPVTQLLHERGQMPLPPYIKRPAGRDDRDWYQTMFAEHEGAIAAPTAGLHFTPPLLQRLAEKSIRVVSVTLHVGLGTFKPVTVERIEDHRMDEEWFEISDSAAEAIAQAKERGGRVVAVGTTVVRALETAVDQGGSVVASTGSSRLFITPGYKFRVVDVLMTNFHLPRTTLVMLVSAFAGIESIQKAYAEAVRERYRFYSYGDAMLIL